MMKLKIVSTFTPHLSGPFASDVNRPALSARSGAMSDSTTLDCNLLTCLFSEKNKRIPNIMSSTQSTLEDHQLRLDKYKYVESSSQIQMTVEWT